MEEKTFKVNAPKIQDKTIKEDTIIELIMEVSYLDHKIHIS